MRRTFQNLFLGLLFSHVAVAASPAKPAVSLEPEPEAWKGKPYATLFQFSFMSGVGLLGSSVGLPLNGAVAVKIAHQGFVDDINDQAYLELMGGPLFVSNTLVGTYSLHLRWDFHKNDYWTFYSLGGLAAEFGGPLVGNYRSFHPRFGIGAMWNLFEFLSFRGEISHEFTGVGISYLL